MPRKTKNTTQDMNGEPPEWMSKDERTLVEFKDRIKDVCKQEYKDYEFRKWLKARNNDVSKAEQMFRSSMAFREKMRSDYILDEYDSPEVLKKYLTGGFLGHDKDGSRVRIELYGRLDMKGLMYSSRKSDLEKTKIYQCEETVLDWKTQSEKLGRRVDGLTVIFDMDCVSTKMMWKTGLQMYLHLVKVLEDNYPEMMKRLLVVNAPRIFPLLYKVVRPLISEDMKNKIYVLGGDYQSTLLRYIDKDELPMFLGGTRTDQDGNPRCTEKICQGGIVPEEYYLSDQDMLANMELLTVARGDKQYLEYVVERPGSILRWEFKTEDYDIGFGIFIEKDGTKIPVLAMERVNSHIAPEDGSVTCTEAGTYYMCFDNSFSWLKGKKLWYSGEVIYTDDKLKVEINELIECNKDWEDLSKEIESTHL